MGGILVLICSVLLLGFLFYQPKLGAVLVWPILMAYPHYHWEQLGLMPLNIGYDDLFICVFFLIVLIRRNIMDGLPMRLGYVLWGSILLSVLQLTSYLSAYFILGTGFQLFLKTILKNFINTLLVYGLVNTIDNVKDLKRTAFAFCFFAGVSGVLVILQKFFPGPMTIFTQTPETIMATVEFVRPTGAFVNANSAAVVMGAACLTIICTINLKSIYFSKGLRFVVLGILALAILITKSRSGFLCLVIPITLMSILGKNKLYVWVLISAGIIATIISPGFFYDLLRRVQTGDTLIKSMMEGVGHHWVDAIKLWKQVTWSRLIFGLPNMIDVHFGSAGAHSVMGIPLRLGLGGALWVITFFVTILHKSKAMKFSPQVSISSFGNAIRWVVLAYLLYGIVGGFFGDVHVKYTLFLLAVFADRGFAIMKQDEQLYQPATESDDNHLATADDYVLVDYHDVNPNSSYEGNRLE